MFRDAISLVISGSMVTIRVSAVFFGIQRRFVQVILTTICLCQFAVDVWASANARREYVRLCCLDTQ